MPRRRLLASSTRALLVLGLVTTIFTMPQSKAVFSAATDNSGSTSTADTLDPPTSVTADDTTPGQIDLSWTPTIDTYADGYNILRSQTAGTGYTYLATALGQATSTFSDTTFGNAFAEYESALQSSASLDVTVAVPAGSSAGDLLLAQITTDGTNSGYTAPAGWTLIASNSTTSGSGFAAYYRIADGSEPADYTFTWASSATAVGSIARYINVDNATPIDTYATTNGHSNSPIAPDITTTTGNTIVVRLLSTDRSAGNTITVPPGHASRYNLRVGGGGSKPASIAADVGQTSAGPTGTATFDPSAGTQLDWTTATIALKPAPTGGTYYYVLQAFAQSWISSNSNEASGTS